LCAEWPELEKELREINKRIEADPKDSGLRQPTQGIDGVGKPCPRRSTET
jgi:hypothetical protein